MFVIVGLLIGAFIAVVAADFLGALDPFRTSMRQGITTARERAVQLIGSKVDNPLVAIGIFLVFLMVVWWLLSFFTALILGFALGVIYREEIEHLPFVSGIAATVRKKISNYK